MTNAPKLADLRVKLFTDGADKKQILDMAAKPWIAGFTTNPSLLRKAGVTDYEAYARSLVAAVPDRHISFEVISDDIPEMVAQARLITTWGKNVYVKLPVINTRGETLYDAVRQLSRDGVKVNVTAIFTEEQALKTIDAVAGGAPACVSVFAGRLADLGIAYQGIMASAIAAGAQDAQCRDHLGLDPRGVQRDRGGPDGLPHHHGAGRRALQAACDRHQDRRGAFARRGSGVPRRCARGGPHPRRDGDDPRGGIGRAEAESAHQRTKAGFRSARRLQPLDLATQPVVIRFEFLDRLDGVREDRR